MKHCVGFRSVVLELAMASHDVALCSIKIKENYLIEYFKSKHTKIIYFSSSPPLFLSFLPSLLVSSIQLHKHKTKNAMLYYAMTNNYFTL